MILISNHLLQTKEISIDSDSVIRINIAWVKDEEELRKYLSVPYDIFLDYPENRKKPPVPTLKLDEVIEIMKEYPNVKFFAISNAEDCKRIRQLRRQLPESVWLVPKIETEVGINFIEDITREALTQYVMLDKEDLYVNVGQNDYKYETLINYLREKCKQINVDIFELTGVIFTNKI